jgi:hypothetical protein
MYFSDVFSIPSETLARENVFDISLVSDLPLFIDPFLIFDSDNPRYQRLHNEIVKYVSFVRNKVVDGTATMSQLEEWLHFPEIRNNWLGYSVGSNEGRGLRGTFAKGAVIGLQGPLSDFGEEQVSRGSHIERLFLFSEGAGKDALSDFVTNLCHGFLLGFTQDFALKHLSRAHCRPFTVRHTHFDYQRGRWLSGTFTLPVFNSDYVLLTPADLLTQSVPWINRPDLFDRFGGMLKAMDDSKLRADVNTFLSQKLAPPPSHPKNKEYRPTEKQRRSAYSAALEYFPSLANWYIAIKESLGEEAVAQSRKRVLRAEEIYRTRVVNFLDEHLRPSGFFDVAVSDSKQLLAVFASCLQQNASALFLGEEKLIEDLSTNDVRLICTLLWRADGNRQRRLPMFRFVYDEKSASQVESVLGIGKPSADTLIITTDRGKKARIGLEAQAKKRANTHVISILPDNDQETTVNSIFISYTKSDVRWARWAGRVLLSAGYEVTAQYKDFLPGSNFVKRMDDAIKGTDRTIAILSKDYLESPFATAEWQAAFREDPLGNERKLVPVRVSKVSVTGLLGSIVYADLVGLSEKSATAILLGAIGAHKRPSENDDAAFPGPSQASDEFHSFLSRAPRNIAFGHSISSAAKRLSLATRILSLTTNQVNLLIYALNPPDNEIPPVSASAKDRAASLLSWSSREGIELDAIEELVRSLST